MPIPRWACFIFLSLFLSACGGPGVPSSSHLPTQIPQLTSTMTQTATATRTRMPTPTRRARPTATQTAIPFPKQNYYAQIEPGEYMAVFELDRLSLLTLDGIEAYSFYLPLEWMTANDGSRDLTLSPNGKYVAGIGRNERLFVLDMQTSEIQWLFTPVYDIDWASDSQRIVAGGNRLSLVTFQNGNWEQTSILPMPHLFTTLEGWEENFRFVDPRWIPNQEYITYWADLSLWALDGYVGSYQVSVACIEGGGECVNDLADMKKRYIDLRYSNEGDFMFDATGRDGASVIEVRNLEEGLIRTIRLPQEVADNAVESIAATCDGQAFIYDYMWPHKGYDYGGDALYRIENTSGPVEEQFFFDYPDGEDYEYIYVDRCVAIE